MPEEQDKRQFVKCVVWDLDNTVWDGVLLEQGEVSPLEDAVRAIKTLDERGILHSVASRNDYDAAMSKLKELGLEEYFLYPQINWNSKVSSIRKVAASLNIGLDSIAFVDDQPFELEEVKFSLPELRCIDRLDLKDILARPEMNPPFVSEDSRARRLLYLSEAARRQEEEGFEGTAEEFLATLRMRFSVRRAAEDDLRRAEELTARTNQLNTTGVTYSYEELDGFRLAEDYRLLMASLEDRFGEYGKVGLALLHCAEREWCIKLLLMSCRVMSRGVGAIMLNHIMGRARGRGVRLLSEFIPNERNRMMYVSYKFAGFREVRRDADLLLLENDLRHVPPCPPYVTLIADDW